MTEQPKRTRRASRRNARRAIAGALALAAILGLALAAPAAADGGRSVWEDYQPDRAGHPLRVLAYAAHPLGVAVDYIVLRPCYWVGQHEPFRTIFGVRH